jgi:hypothetical protein
MQRAIDWAIVTGRRLLQEQRIGHDIGIEAIADQLLLVLLEGFSCIERGREPHEQRMRIRRQPLRQMIGESPDIEVIAGHDRRHAGAAGMVRDCHAIGGGVAHAGVIEDRLVHLAGRDILALPAKGIAEAVDEVEKASRPCPPGVGALAILMAFGFDFSLIALIGVILLIGIVKKNGIMMIDFAIAAEREEHLSAQQSIRKAAILRFRPIMMTTMAALLGGLPLMLGTGTGSKIRQPLGYAMVGGLLVSQALTLFTTPVVYLDLDNLSNAAAR